MDLILDPTTEQRIQREIDLGHYRDPAEVIARAVALLEAEQEWLLRNREVINQRLDESFAQAERGEVHTPEEARRIIERDRQTRIAGK